MNFQPNLIVDLHEMLETSERFQENGNVVERFLPTKRRQHNTMIAKVFDPVTSYKEAVVSKGRKKSKKPEMREYSPIRRLSDENVSWLANEWIKENGDKLPTRRQVLEGLIEEDKQEVLRLFPRFRETHAAVEEVLKKRALAWKTLCTVAGFSIKNMDAPINRV